MGSVLHFTTNWPSYPIAVPGRSTMVKLEVSNYC